MKNTLLFLIIVLFSCSRDKLKDEYDIIEGKYNWVFTNTSDGSIWTNNEPRIYPDRTNYTCAVEFDGNGKVKFYKDGSLINETKYTILEKESYDDHSAYIYIKIKNLDNMKDLTDGKLTFRLSNDTLLYVNRFPFHAIDKASNYYQNYTSTENSFIRD